MKSFRVVLECSADWSFLLVLLFHHRDEADEFVEIGALNGIFVLGRSMGFIGESVQHTGDTVVTLKGFVYHTRNVKKLFN